MLLLLPVPIPTTAQDRPGDPEGIEECIPRHQATELAETLEAEGAEVEISETQCDVTLTSIQLRGFDERSVADRIQSELQDHGIDALVTTDPDGRTFTIRTGAYLEPASVERRLRQLREAGFPDPSVEELPRTITLHTVRWTMPVQVARVPALEAIIARPPPPEPEPEPDPEPDLLVLNDREPVPPDRIDVPAAPTADIGVDDLWLEHGVFTKRRVPVDTSSYLHASASARWQPTPSWEFRVGGRVDGFLQTGDPDFDTVRTDLGSSFVRYRGESARITAGAQAVTWGRVDEIPPTDQLSVHDASRYVLDDIEDRRRVVPGLRVEQFFDGFKLDLLWNPRFREAELPHKDSVWHPVDQSRGRLFGIESEPRFDQLIREGRFDRDEPRDGEGGIRLSRTGRLVDFGVTVQRARHSLPYYELDPEVREVLLATGDPTAAIDARPDRTFVARHPRTWVAGLDLEWAVGGVTWRMEGAYLSDVPVTTDDLRLVTVEGGSWVIGGEFYPGDADTRVNVQLAGQHRFTDRATLDRQEIYTINGMIEQLLDHGRAEAYLRYSIGLDERDLYLNPGFAVVALEPHEFYVDWHYFEGTDGTPGDFHRDNRLMTFGWRARY